VEPNPKRPAAHCPEQVEVCNPVVPPNVPQAHTVQLEEPVDENEPATHKIQLELEELPVLRLYVPALHLI